MGVEPTRDGFAIRCLDSVTVESASDSGEHSRSVAPKVAPETTENGCKQLVLDDQSDNDRTRLVEEWLERSPVELSSMVKRVILAALDPGREPR